MTPQENDHVFRQFAENFRGVILVIAIHPRKLLYVSPAYATIWGQSCEHLSENLTAWMEAVHPDDRERVEQAYRDSAEQGFFNEEYRIIRPNGEVCWLWGQFFPIKNAAGEVYRIAVIAEDISDRRQAETTLQNLMASTFGITGEDFFPTLVRNLAETLKVCYVLVTEYIDGKFQTLSFWGHGQLQPDLTYLAAKTPCEIAFQKGRFYCGSHLQRAFPEDLELVKMQAESYFGIALTDHQGKAIGNLCILDVQPFKQTLQTEAILQVFAARAAIELQRKQAEDYLHRYRRMVANTADGLALVDRQYSFQIVNPIYLERRGKTDDEILGSKVWTIYGIEVFETFIKPSLDRCFAGETIRFETWFPFVRTGQRFMAVTCSPYRDAPGVIAGAIISSRDITDLKQAELKLQQQEEFLRVVINTSQNLIFVKDGQGQYLLGNQAIADFYGLPLENLIGKSDLEIYGDSIITEQLHQESQAIIQYQQALFIPEEKRINPQGQEEWWQWQKHPITVPKQNIPAVLSIGSNITARKQIELALRNSESRLQESESLLRAMFEGSAVGITIIDRNGQYVRSNPYYQTLIGYSEQELVGKRFTDFTLEEYLPENMKLFNEVVRGKRESYQLEKRYRHRDSHLFWVRVTCSKIVSETNHPPLFVELIENINDRKQIQEIIIHNALHDPLTDLPNRSLLMQRIELAISRKNRVKTYHYAILFLDLDRFKVINDSLGHLAGDELLKYIARKLKSRLRETDLVARFGGDEFVILLEDISSIEHIIRLTERILADCQVPLMLNGYEMSVSTSIGIVLGNEHYKEASELLRDADIAMYRAENKGGNVYKLFDTEMHTQALTRLTLETELRKALEREEFLVYYQPIIDILGDRLIGFEALVRWQHPIHGLIAPADFIPIAEEMGLIVALDHWILHTACQQMAHWQNTFSHHFPLRISVNLSVKDLLNLNLLEDIEKILAETGLAGDIIDLEITESMLIEDINHTIALLERLKARKIQISIDDFGMGYSSLNYLHRLPANNLKIDRTFIQQMQKGDRNYQVVSTIITLSNQLGLAVVAEGIETSQQLHWLQELGCELGQGYLFSPALTAQEIETQFLENYPLSFCQLGLTHSALATTSIESIRPK